MGDIAGGEERVERQAFHDGDWWVMLYTDGAHTEENWWYRQEGGAAGAGTLSQGTDLLWPRHQWTPAEVVPVGCGARVGSYGSRSQGRNFSPVALLAEGSGRRE